MAAPAPNDFYQRSLTTIKIRTSAYGINTGGIFPTFALNSDDPILATIDLYGEASGGGNTPLFGSPSQYYANIQANFLDKTGNPTLKVYNERVSYTGGFFETTLFGGSYLAYANGNLSCNAVQLGQFTGVTPGDQSVRFSCSIQSTFDSGPVLQTIGDQTSYPLDIITGGYIQGNFPIWPYNLDNNQYWIAGNMTGLPSSGDEPYSFGTLILLDQSLSSNVQWQLPGISNYYTSVNPDANAVFYLGGSINYPTFDASLIVYGYVNDSDNAPYMAYEIITASGTPFYFTIDFADNTDLQAQYLSLCYQGTGTYPTQAYQIQNGKLVFPYQDASGNVYICVVELSSLFYDLVKLEAEDSLATEQLSTLFSGSVPSMSPFNWIADYSLAKDASDFRFLGMSIPSGGPGGVWPIIGTDVTVPTPTRRLKDPGFPIPLIAVPCCSLTCPC